MPRHQRLGYKSSKTLAEARTNGARNKDLRFDWKNLWLRMPKAKSMKAMKAANKDGIQLRVVSLETAIRLCEKVPGNLDAPWA